MPPALTQKLAGIPRWGWVLIIGSGLLLGVYLRHRQAMAAATSGDTTTATDQSQADAGVPVDPGLAGIYAPGSGGSAIPVENPVIPQGFSDALTTAIGALTEAQTGANANQAATAQAGYDAIAGILSTVTLPIQNGAGSGAATTTETAPTGGGPPSTGGSRSTVHPDSQPAAIPGTKPATKGATVRGKTFKGATGYTAGGVGYSGGKDYREYRIYFPGGKSEVWHFYNDGNKWVQGH